jgi:hypothetical protein
MPRSCEPRSCRAVTLHGAIILAWFAIGFLPAWRTVFRSEVRNLTDDAGDLFMTIVFAASVAAVLAWVELPRRVWMRFVEPDVVPAALACVLAGETREQKAARRQCELDARQAAIERAERELGIGPYAERERP